MDNNILISVMNHINNHFVIAKESGDYVIHDGMISLFYDYMIGQYIYISGSVLNDGLYQINDDLISLDGSIDESFSGTVYRLAIPRHFMSLAQEIEAFESDPIAKSSNIVSASFGIQSFSFGTDGKGNRAGWETVFAKRLNQYRRMTTDIDILEAQ